MELNTIIDAIKKADKVLIIEDTKAVMIVMGQVMKRLNPNVTVLKATNLEEAQALADKVDDSTVVLSDYSFPDKKGSPVRENGRATHDLFYGKCMFYAITTSHIKLPDQDTDLEPFRADKDAFRNLLVKESAPKAEAKSVQVGKYIYTKLDPSTLPDGFLAFLKGKYPEHQIIVRGQEISAVPAEVLYLGNEEGFEGILRHDLGNMFFRTGTENVKRGRIVLDDTLAEFEGPGTERAGKVVIVVFNSEIMYSTICHIFSTVCETQPAIEVSLVDHGGVVKGYKPQKGDKVLLYAFSDHEGLNLPFRVHDRITGMINLATLLEKITRLSASMGKVSEPNKPRGAQPANVQATRGKVPIK